MTVPETTRAYFCFSANNPAKNGRESWIGFVADFIEYGQYFVCSGEIPEGV